MKADEGRDESGVAEDAKVETRSLREGVCGRLASGSSDPNESSRSRGPLADGRGVAVVMVNYCTTRIIYH